MDTHERAARIGKISRQVADGMFYGTALDADRALYLIERRARKRIADKDRAEILADAVRHFREVIY